MPESLHSMSSFTCDTAVSPVSTSSALLDSVCGSNHGQSSVVNYVVRFRNSVLASPDRMISHSLARKPGKCLWDSSNQHKRKTAKCQRASVYELSIRV